ncbi:RNA-binding protein [Tahibacter amnicola]|uniref:RNA-binding protein n=1 Tax=Tahibacter amnicola TaxID=2976241 RepID=A0ABY6BCR2_9GAMM|nr:RNA-binding protein [Tahibacter amnicola]UXI67834.1 RNA-binding protein [Tahibacter amnicola]
MANQQLFASRRGAFVPAANTTNEAGGAAYQRDAVAALAVYAATGCLNGVFYADAQTQLAQVLRLCEAVPTEFVARTALYARQNAYMKDMPALLLAHLAQRDGALCEKIFDRVVDNGRMLRNFVQIVRSGVTGRKSLGTRPKRLVRQWLERASVDQILAAAVGQSPSLADVIRMVHPRPQDAEREALYAWLIDRPYKAEALPAKVQAYETFKQNHEGDVPDVPFLFLTNLPLTDAHWTAIARRASWQTARMNLNTFQRHGVFAKPDDVGHLAAKLRDPAHVARARAFPYQLFAAWNAITGDMPQPLRDALQDAMELATQNVPVLAGNVVVAVDVSGSMSSPVTGNRPGSTTKMRCVDVAALIAACVKRKNPSARVIPFNTQVVSVTLNPRDSITTQATTLANALGGGTTVSAPLARLNAEKAMVDTLIIVSDNQSWADTCKVAATATMKEWSTIKHRCPGAKLVCIDLQPYMTSQTVESADVLHVGGFSDAVFDVLGTVASNGLDMASWKQRIERISL